MGSTYKQLQPQCETTLKIEYFQKLARIEVDFKAELDAYRHSFEIERSECHSRLSRYKQEEEERASIQKLKDLESQVLSSRAETVGFFARTRFWMPSWASWLVAAWLTWGDRSIWNAQASLSDSVSDESLLAKQRKQEEEEDSIWWKYAWKRSELRDEYFVEVESRGWFSGKKWVLRDEKKKLDGCLGLV
ncbi:hypothetical protein QBC42DRAFT_284173 [Cladorrhinum samala]|uniref:Uncharacterized protein n=1 Tax=Cladorrhinum samala TaxID=585594 RepID=A0AAV9HVA0_9PEZI|nr:hypothetical protein QBC42DRAFT_284173 [Cladorrhinum samala]